MNISKISRVAGREFASTAMTKGFIIGALVMPAVIAALMALNPGFLDDNVFIPFQIPDIKSLS